MPKVMLEHPYISLKGNNMTNSFLSEQFHIISIHEELVEASYPSKGFFQLLFALTTTNR